MFRTLAALTLALSLAGCTTAPNGGPTAPRSSSSAPSGEAFSEQFEGTGLPPGWTPHRGTWTAANGTVQGAGAADPGLSSLVAEREGAYAKFTFQVDFEMLSGEHPQGAGVVFDWKNDGNFLIVRYSISEQGWHLFSVVDGNRDKKGDATIAHTTSPQFGEWVHLKVVQAGDEVLVYDGSTLVIEYELEVEDSHAGSVGLFVRGNTVARFDNATLSL